MGQGSIVATATNGTSFDETAQFERSELSTDAATPQPKNRRIAPQLLSRSRPDLSDEIADVLRHRLRVAALLLFAGLFTFFVYRLFVPKPFSAPALGILGPISFWAHAGTTLIIGSVGIRLCTNCRHLNSHLRMTEFLVFGSAVFFFLIISWCRLVEFTELGFVAPITVPWIILVFTYSFFVPNDWRRALRAIVPMTLAPIVMFVAGWMTSPRLADLMAQPQFRGVAFETTVTMLLAAAISIWGVRSIRSLRREAFEAKQLGQYRLKQLLGSGGMGDVYVGEHLLLKRPCAIKLIRPEKAGDPRVLERFEREVQSTARLTHWNTVDIYDFGRADDGTFYYVMEYLPGLNLQELVELHGALPEGRVLHLMLQTCDALSEAHAAGMVHRDLKPANIYAAIRGRKYDVAKLLDFGLVRPLEAAGQDMMITQQNTVVGSPLFMSPEQASGETADVRSDIYSLGIVAYYLLAGQLPFDGDTAIKIVLAHAQQEPESLVRYGVSPEVNQIVMKCLEKDPQHRFESADALRKALDQCDAATAWDWADSAAWWQNHGCPKKKEVDAKIARGQEPLPIPA